MPAQPAADRAAVPPEVAAAEPPPREWPRFEVCIDGRCPIEDTLNVIASRWKILILWMSLLVPEKRAQKYNE